MSVFRSAFITVSLSASPLAAAELEFCWVGANGWTMTGRMNIPDSAMTQPIITEEDVAAFHIAGYQNGEMIGTWDMAQDTQDSTFHLRFDPKTMTFLTGGSFPTRNSQGWNADGSAENCGNPGFGFNAGNYAQDLCLNGVWIEDSGVDPATTFSVKPAHIEIDCGGGQVLSLLSDSESFRLTANHVFD